MTINRGGQNDGSDNDSYKLKNKRPSDFEYILNVEPRDFRIVRLRETETSRMPWGIQAKITKKGSVDKEEKTKN